MQPWEISLAGMYGAIVQINKQFNKHTLRIRKEAEPAGRSSNFSEGLWFDMLAVSSVTN